jgi:hypothetical protein
MMIDLRSGVCVSRSSRDRVVLAHRDRAVFSLFNRGLYTLYLRSNGRDWLRTSLTAKWQCDFLSSDLFRKAGM